jgi:hypothetical protein
LHLFDVIYTLNQDTLIEQKYVGQSLVGNGSKRCILPGIKPAGTSFVFKGEHHHYYTHDANNFFIADGHQPYIKLHGSYNWTQDVQHDFLASRRSILILGGNKELTIKKFPLLVWYHERFKSDLSTPGALLMIIGYSFNDGHINHTIIDSISKNDLKIFIIDPLGVDVLDKRDPKTAIRLPRSELVECLSPRIIGASRRSLLQTFADDVVEHAKIMKFFDK